VVATRHAGLPEVVHGGGKRAFLSWDGRPDSRRQWRCDRPPWPYDPALAEQLGLAGPTPAAQGQFTVRPQHSRQLMDLKCERAVLDGPLRFRAGAVRSALSDPPFPLWRQARICC